MFVLVFKLGEGGWGWEEGSKSYLNVEWQVNGLHEWYKKGGG